MGKYHSKYQHSDDNDEERYFSVTSEAEEERVSNDEKLAEKLQLQEIEERIWSDTCMDESLCNICMDESLCNICMESKPLEQFWDIKFCSHKFCISCMSQYVSAKLDNNVIDVSCPEPGCRDGVLEPLDLQFILPRNTFERWCNALCQQLVKEKFYCPFSECSALMEAGDADEEEGVMTVSECPHCNRLFCAQCKVPWHNGMDCKDFQKLGEDERGREDLLLRQLAAKHKWQRCPQCMITVERIDGCRLMKCRCGHCFCYICASPMSEADHYCYKCSC